MKNLFVFAICLILGSSLFTSCQKEELSAPTIKEITVEDLDKEAIEYLKTADLSNIEEARTVDSPEEASSRSCGTYMRYRSHDYRGIWKKENMGYHRYGIMKSCDGNPTYIVAFVVDGSNRYLRKLDSQYNPNGYSYAEAYNYQLNRGEKLRFYFRNWTAGRYVMIAK